MKKLMALCLAMLMALSMVSFSVMAEETAAVDFSAIANGQPAAFVTSNLVLGEHTITSSNEAVIATDGTVTRPLYEDATVTLTINGGEAVEVTVKAKTANVLYNTDFSVDSTPASKAFPGYTGWFFGNDVTNSTAISGGKLYADHGVEGADKGYMYLYAPTMSSAVSTRPVTYSFSVSDIANISVGVDIRLSGSWYDENGTKLKDFSNVTISRCNSLSGFGSYGFTTGVSASKKFSFKYDPTTGDSWLNGKKCEYYNSGAKETYHLLGLLSWTQNKNTGVVTEVRAPEGAASVKITNFLFVDAGSTSKGSYKLDDFVVYEDVPAEEVLAAATPAEKAAYYAPYLEKEYIAPTADFSALSSNLNLTPDEELIDGVSIVWSSSNPAVVSNNGVLNRPIEGETAVTLTGTLSVDGTEYLVKTYNFNVLPLTVSYKSEIVDAENLVAGTSFAGATGWNKSIQSWERMDVGQDADGNKYFSICASAYQPSGTSPVYTFQTVPTYTIGETFVFEAKVRIPVKAGVANWGFLLNGYEIAEFIYYNGYLYDNDYDLGNDGYYGGGTARYDKAVTAGQWYDIKIEAYKNAEGSFAKCYIDNKLVGTHKTKNAIPASITSAQFQFTGRSNMDSLGPDKDHPDRPQPTTPVNFFHTDDIRLSKKISDEAAVQLLADADKVAYYKKLISATPVTEAKIVGEDLKIGASYALMDSAVTGVTVAWVSSNAEYISNEGTVLKLTTVDAPVTVNLTATITAGSVTDTVVFPVRIGDGSTLVSSENFETLEGDLYVQDSAEHGKVAYLKNETAGRHKSQTFGTVHGAERGDRVMMEADIKYRRLDNAGSGGFTFNLLAGRLGAYISLNYASKTIGVHTTAGNVDTAGLGFTVENAKTIYYPMPESVIAKGEGEWVHIAVDHNSMSQTLYVYVDGVLLNDLPLVQADMELSANSGAAVRSYSIQLSGAGEMWVDNVSLRKLDDATETEVDAALNAALIDYASDLNKPVLTNCALPAMTIGASWINKAAYLFNRDLSESGTIKASNIATYTYVTDGPAITWTVDGKAATAINVASPKEVTITVTATKDGISKSKTFTKTVAPAAIRGLALGTAECLNGAWIDGAAGTEKLILACYKEGALVSADVIDFAEEGEWDSKTGTGNRFNVATGIVGNLATANPKEAPGYDQVKLFIVAADGITPLALVAELNE